MKNERNEKFLRTYTISELSQIQGFPKEYQFKGNQKSIITQIGNAVPPLFIKQMVYSLDTITFVEHDEKEIEDESDDEDE